MKTYLGVDPGLRTGACLIESTKSEVTLVDQWDIPNGAQGFSDWWKLIGSKFKIDRIVCESFILREGSYGVDLSPRDVIGALKALCDDVSRLSFRPPSGRSKQVPDFVMKSLGMYLPGNRNRNAKEAVRHVLCELKAERHPVILGAFGG